MYEYFLCLNVVSLFCLREAVEGAGHRLKIQNQNKLFMSRFLCQCCTHAYVIMSALAVCRAEGSQSGNFSITPNQTRGLCNTSREDTIILVIRSLHWLPVWQRIHKRSAFGSLRTEWFGTNTFLICSSLMR